MPFTPPSTVASKANTGQFTVLQIGDSSSPPVYTPISEAKSVSLDGFSMSDIDVTHLLSPGNASEQIPGLIKVGQVSVSGNYIGDASQQTISTDAGSRTIFLFQIVAPIQRLAKTLTVSGSGYFSSLKIGPFEPDKPIEFSTDIKLTGPLSYAVA